MQKGMKGPQGGKRPAARAPDSPEKIARRKRVEALEKQGLTRDAALAVANGQLSVNDAVERMMRDDEAHRIAEKHGLAWSLAMQVTLGHANLAEVLARREAEQLMAEAKARTVFDNPGQWTLGQYGQASRQVRFVSHSAYEVEVDPEPSPVHKTSIKYAFLADDYKRVRKGLSYDKAGRSIREPVLRPQDRLPLSDRAVGVWWQAKTPLIATLHEGEVFEGEIVWASRFEIALKLRSGVEVIVFRHALQSLVA